MNRRCSPTTAPRRARCAPFRASPTAGSRPAPAWPTRGRSAATRVTGRAGGSSSTSTPGCCGGTARSSSPEELPLPACEPRSVDRSGVHPLDEVVGRERPYPGGVPGEVGVVEEVAPLAARAPAEERGGVDPVLRTTGGDGRDGPAAHRLERRRGDEAGP